MARAAHAAANVAVSHLLEFVYAPTRQAGIVVDTVKAVETVKGIVMTERVATSAEVASALALSASTVQLYARQGRIPFATTPGGHRRYSVSEVQLALAPSPDDTDDPVTMLLTPLSGSLGAGRPGPTSANAQLVRGQRVAMAEGADEADDEREDELRGRRPGALGISSGEHGSALAWMVAHSRSLSLTCVKT